MFDNINEEREQWNRYFDFFVNKFKEDVGICPAVYETDEYEADISVGENSAKILGIRLYRYVPVENDDSNSEGTENQGNTSNEDEIEEMEYEVYQMDFVLSDDQSLIEELEREGEVFLEFEFKNPAKEKEQLSTIKFYKNQNDEVLGAIEVFHHDPAKKFYFEPKIFE